MKLSIIIIDTNELHFLRPCLRSVFGQTKGIDFEVFVVDNASTDGSREAIAREFPTVKVVVNTDRLGFAAANNVAIPHATGEYILLLNPDTEVLDGAIGKTVDFMENHPRAGVAGCRLLYPDGSVQPSVRGFPTLLNVFLEATFLYHLLPKDRIVRTKGLVRFDYSHTEEVDWLIGAYFMIRRSLLEKNGLLDEQFWIYGEEEDYCQRARNSGFEIWYVSDARVVHHYRGMTAYTLRLIVWLYFWHKLYTEKHYRGTTQFLMKNMKWLGGILRAIFYPVAGCITMDRSLFSKAYYHGVALYKVLTVPLKYERRDVGKVEPWTKYL